MKVFKTLSILFIISIQNVLTDIYFTDYDFLVHGWINCFSCVGKSKVFVQAGIRHDRDIFDPHLVDCGGTFSVRGRALGYSVQYRLYFQYRITCYLDKEQRTSKRIDGYIGNVTCEWRRSSYRYLCNLHTINVL